MTATLDYAAKAERPKSLSGHIPALDGVRGLAILLVLLAHYVLISNSHGFLETALLFVSSHAGIGVDLFFVLSGFLITGILWDSKGSDNYFRNFYARRTLRIFPLYYLMIFISLVLIPRFLPGVAAKFDKFDGSHKWFWLYVSNFYFGLNPEHFGKGIGMLNVSWSLAIEEQFYLVWPALVFLCNRRTLLAICGALIATAIGTRFYISLHNYGEVGGGYVPVYVFTFTRMDALSTGALVALTLRSPNGLSRLVRYSQIASCVAVPALIAFSWNWWGHWRRHWDQTLAYTFEAIVCATLLISGLAYKPVAHILSRPWLTIFGRYSYAMYFLHVPASWVLRKAMHLEEKKDLPLILGSQLPVQIFFFVSATAVTLGLSLLSWHLFEKHFLALKKYFPSHSEAKKSKPAAETPAATSAANSIIAPNA